MFDGLKQTKSLGDLADEVASKLSEIRCVESASKETPQRDAFDVDSFEISDDICVEQRRAFSESPAQFSSGARIETSGPT